MARLQLLDLQDELLVEVLQHVALPDGRVELHAKACCTRLRQLVDTMLTHLRVFDAAAVLHSRVWTRAVNIATITVSDASAGALAHMAHAWHGIGHSCASLKNLRLEGMANEDHVVGMAAPALSGCPSLRGLALVIPRHSISSPRSAFDLARAGCASWTSLHRLQLDLDSRSCDVSPLQRLPALRELQVHAAVANGLSSLTQIHNLDLAAHHVTARNLLTCVEPLTQLVALTMAGRQQTYTDASRLSVLTNLTSLRINNLDRSLATAPLFSAAALGCLTRLQELHLPGVITTQLFHALSSATGLRCLTTNTMYLNLPWPHHLPPLASLTLLSTGIDDTSSSNEHYLQAEARTVMFLALSAADTSADTAAHLSLAAAMPSLHTLSIVNDEALRSPYVLRGCTNLSSLSLLVRSSATIENVASRRATASLPLTSLQLVLDDREVTSDFINSLKCLHYIKHLRLGFAQNYYTTTAILNQHIEIRLCSAVAKLTNLQSLHMYDALRQLRGVTKLSALTNLTALGGLSTEPRVYVEGLTRIFATCKQLRSLVLREPWDLGSGDAHDEDAEDGDAVAQHSHAPEPQQTVPLAGFDELRQWLHGAKRAAGMHHVDVLVVQDVIPGRVGVTVGNM